MQTGNSRGCIQVQLWIKLYYENFNFGMEKNIYRNLKRKLNHSGHMYLKFVNAKYKRVFLLQLARGQKVQVDTI